MKLFIIVISFVILQRIIELFIAKHNERWLLSRGAVEYGRKHYKFIVMLHIAFILSIILEYFFRGRYYELNLINYSFLVIFILLQFLRVWVLTSLGRYWCTRVYRIPGESLVTGGIYRYLKHPNYIVVIGEILVLPLIFDLYYTAAIFTILNALMLSVRIRVENKVLAN
jgi:methyltransferase